MRSRNGASGSGNEARTVNARMALTLSDPTGCHGTPGFDPGVQECALRMLGSVLG